MIIAALYAGSLMGAVNCGFGVDIIGRKLVWQFTLLFVTIFTLISAGSPNFAALCVFIGLQGIGAGGNFAIDPTVFVESLPKAKDYLLTALPLWWGYLLVGGIAFVLASLRIFCMKMEESPQWLVTQGKFDEAIAAPSVMARDNKTELSIITSDFYPVVNLDD
ncbi:hypothetical protein ACHAPT_013486, partial [Fusarium lateritium]